MRNIVNVFFIISCHDHVDLIVDGVNRSFAISISMSFIYLDSNWLSFDIMSLL